MEPLIRKPNTILLWMKHYALAVEEYQSYEGCHGIMSWDDCREDLIDSSFDYDDEAVDDRYQEELESWLSYYVEPEEE